MSKRIWIVGSEGQLGRACSRILGADACGLDLPGFDMTDRAAVLHWAEREPPRAVINCAAYTLADKAETETELCWKINTEAVKFLAEVARQADCPLVQVSTDYVFGGDRLRRTPYRESDPPAPLSVYGRSKQASEEVAATWSKHFVVRTNALFGVTPRNNNFVEAMLRIAREKGKLRVLDDQTCSPTHVDHLARAMAFLLTTEAYGIYHIVGTGDTTWFGFAAEILRQTDTHVPLERITTHEFNAAAERPAYSVLDTSKYHALGGPPMPRWEEGLAEYLRQRG